MKRKVFIPIVSLLLAFVMIFAVACGNNGGNTEKATYTVTYLVNGAEFATQTYKEGNLLVSPGEPYVDGYEFEGWNTSEDGTGTEWIAGTAVTANATYYAVLKSTSGNNPGGNQGNNPGGNPDDNPGGEVTTYTVTFIVDGETFDIQEVESGKTVTPPTPPERDGEMFVGWYESVAMASAYDFTKPVTSNLILTARYAELAEGVESVGAYNESLYVVWGDTNPANAIVEYVAAGENNWTKVDAPLVRTISDTEARVDILGLAAGSYNVRITTSAGDAIQLSAPIAVTSYDRSGYAHFNYDKGVGAYNDDGTLKENALVIYVTEENKDTVMNEVCAANDDINMFNIPYSGYGKDWGGKAASGIGWWLNNNQYTSNNVGSDKNKRPSNTYDAANGGKLGFKSVDRPIVVRFIGEVTTPEGCSALDEDEGGINGDNGHMARMKNLKNVTVEGVGEDAVIRGWGFHFIAGTDAKDGQGTSFEVRNLTFYEYPEDAVGMEGQQSRGKITAGVERCWIHNNTFLPGYCANPKESDKKEGDGSCDFKRGQYFTASYNWFEYCHKTNLIGSADSSLQYNMTYHHNVWWQCGSRIPLTRQANVHFYNNYVYVNAADTSSPYSWVKVSPSYVHSLRANCYLFSEANYYDGAKNITDGKSGGAAKGLNNIYYANYGTNTIDNVASREQTVPNNCKYNGIDYSKFDTDSTLFYYKDGKSDCLLDDAMTARQKAMMHAGANGHGANVNTAMNYYTPDSAVTVGESGTVITLPSSKGDSTVNGVMFKAITGVSSGTIKFKGQGITFTLTAQAQLTVTTATTGDTAPELVGADGYVYAHKFEGTLTIVLEAGTYFIASGQKDKEANISSMKFDDTGASRDARLAAAKEAIAALPETVALTAEHEALIKAARSAYNALTSSEKTLFAQENPTYLAKLEAAETAYGQLLIAEFKKLVAAIGTVNENSYDRINAAQVVYDKLTSDQKAQVAGEKATLDAAWAAFEEFEVLNVINMINAFAAKVDAVGDNTERATIEALIEEGEVVQAAYNLLSDSVDEGESQQSQVTNYAKLTEAVAKLQSINNLFIFIDRLEAFAGHSVTMSDAADVSNLQKAYSALTDTQLNKLTEAQKAEYNRVVEEFETVMSVTITSDFSNAGHASDTTGTFVATGSQKSSALTVKGVKYAKGLKLDSNGKLTINVTVKSTLTLYVLNSSTLKLDGATTDAPTASTEADTEGYFITFILEAGVHEITKGGGENSIYYAILSPAA